MKKTVFIITFLAFSFSNYAQTSISLESCYELARQNHPLYSNLQINGETNSLEIKNLNTNYLPSVNFNAQATYQSDVVTIEIPMPGVNIPQPTKEQYKLTVDFQQVIYDGGLTKELKKIQQLNSEAENWAIETLLYKLKEEINTAFFGILLIQQKIALYEVVVNELNNKLLLVESGIKNGAALESDRNLLKAEILTNEQEIISLQSDKFAAINSLSTLINSSLDHNSKLELPSNTVPDFNSEPQQRPENQLYQLKNKILSEQSYLLSINQRPKLAGFGQLGVGKPGLNMLSDEMNEFYIIGAKLSWNIWDWKKTKREKQIVHLQIESNENTEKAFNQTITILLQQERDKILKYNQLIAKDLEIIELREKIAKNSYSQYENGAITLNDYLSDFNLESAAKIRKEVNLILLQQATANFTVINGSK